MDRSATLTLLSDGQRSAALQFLCSDSLSVPVQPRSMQTREQVPRLMPALPWSSYSFVQLSGREEFLGSLAKIIKADGVFVPGYKASSSS
jgi:hypothetical protein